MHIILGMLGILGSIIYILNRLLDLGIDFGWLNPFWWQHRRKWRKKYAGQPIFKVDNPMDLAALLIVGLARVDGDISLEEKSVILEMFKDEFNLPEGDAAALMTSSVYLLGKGEEFRDQLDKILKPGIDKFSEEQITSTLEMLRKISVLNSSQVALKKEFMGKIERHFQLLLEPKGRW